jgi:hypothetical protein
VERTRRIKAIQGQGNRFVEDYAAIFGKAAPASTPQVTPPVVSVPAAPAKPAAVHPDGTCGTKTKCGQMTSCEEAKFYLNQCGIGSLDGNKDGVPCEKLCR